MEWHFCSLFALPHSQSTVTQHWTGNRNTTEIAIKQYTWRDIESRDAGRLLRFLCPITIVAGESACPVDSTPPTGKAFCIFFAEDFLLFCKHHSALRTQVSLTYNNYGQLKWCTQEHLPLPPEEGLEWCCYGGDISEYCLVQDDFHQYS